MSHRNSITSIIGSLTLGTLVLVGCGDKKAEQMETEPSEHAEGGAGGGDASFKEGGGLILPPGVVRALAISTVETAERPLVRRLSVTAQVYAAGTNARAVALVSSGQADEVKPGLRATINATGEAVAELVAISRIAEKASGQVELVFVLLNAPTLALGDTVTLTVNLAVDSPALVVPRSAVLDTATGTFVYVVNGTAYLRTPVKIGASDDSYFEITDGLYEGDIVVVTPVNQLWLSELRLTKGGGHSH
jgi:hypothetical protein